MCELNPDYVRDRLLAAAEQLERMSKEQLSVLTDDLRSIHTEFNKESDIVDFRFGLGSEHGITGWECSLERGMKDGEPIVDEYPSTTDEVKTITHGTTSGPRTTSLDLFHPTNKPMAARQTVQNIYDTLIYVIGKDDTTMRDISSRFKIEFDITDKPSTNEDVFTQQREPWDGSLVVTEEMRAPDPENHVLDLSREQLPNVLSEVDAGVPMTRFQCDRGIVLCTKTPYNDYDEIQKVPQGRRERYRAALGFADGECARGIAVVEDELYENKEEWVISKSFHPECGPSPEVFESGEDDLSLLKSNGKDEVYFEGTTNFGPEPPRDDPVPKRSVYFEDITVLARRR